MSQCILFDSNSVFAYLTFCFLFCSSMRLPFSQWCKFGPPRRMVQGGLENLRKFCPSRGDAGILGGAVHYSIGLLLPASHGARATTQRTRAGHVCRPWRKNNVCVIVNSCVYFYGFVFVDSLLNSLYFYGFIFVRFSLFFHVLCR